MCIITAQMHCTARTYRTDHLPLFIYQFTLFSACMMSAQYIQNLNKPCLLNQRVQPALLPWISISRQRPQNCMNFMHSTVQCKQTHRQNRNRNMRNPCHPKQNQTRPNQTEVDPVPFIPGLCIYVCICNVMQWTMHACNTYVSKEQEQKRSVCILRVWVFSQTIHMTKRKEKKEKEKNQPLLLSTPVSWS